MSINRPLIEVVKRYGMLKVAGLTPYHLMLEEDEASELYLKLAEALDQFIHEPDGCRGDCPCKERER